LLKASTNQLEDSLKHEGSMMMLSGRSLGATEAIQQALQVNPNSLHQAEQKGDSSGLQPQSLGVHDQEQSGVSQKPSKDALQLPNLILVHQDIEIVHPQLLGVLKGPDERSKAFRERPEGSSRLRGGSSGGGRFWWRLD